ncbi:MAG: pyruvate kinase, partial [Dehalococcoidia bacterium]|nr:pyruvate kinase [Dehalococcoidia bacterium]
SRRRPPILALTPHESVQRELTLSWGVNPIIGPTLTNLENLLGEAEDLAVSHVSLTDGDKLVLTAGTPLGVPGSTNLLYVMNISKDGENPSR